MKKIFLIILIISISIGGFWLVSKYFKQPNQNNPISKCELKEVTFYYLETCEWCNKVKNEGTLEKIENLGIKINKINAAVGPIRHQFEGVPTFVIDGKVYEGYRTFEELKELLRCPKEETLQPSPTPQNTQNTQNTRNTSLPDILSEINFVGEKGEKVGLKSSEVVLIASIFNDNQARFYNVKMPSGKTIYFFVVKDRNGVYRAAANACQVCFKTYKGFRQEGDEIVCNNCGNRYPIEKIATEKGGCNPGPINPNLEVRNGQVIVKQTDLERVSDLF